jgi:hypothetical protein
MAARPSRPDRAAKSARPLSTDATSPEPFALPRWLAPALYALVTLVLFRDFIASSAMLFGADTESLGYMARAFYAEQLRAGDFPLWNPLILGGTPFLDSLAGGDSLYPPSLLLLLLLEPHRALGWKLVLHVFAAGLFTHGWVRSLGASRAAALVAGLAYMVGPFFVTLVFPAHDGKMFVTALTPLLFWAVERWFSSRDLRALAGIGAVVALVILTTHFQMAYFLFMAAGAYALFRFAQTWRGRETNLGGRRAAGAAFGLFLGASVLGAATAGVQFIPALEYVTESSRRTATTTAAAESDNRAYAASWSLHPEEALAALAVPEFVGGNVSAVAPPGPRASALAGGWLDGTYWGRNAFKLNHEYLGLAVVLLALVGLGAARRRGVAWFSFGLATIALLYALGEHTPVWGAFYALVPGIQLFRAPSMAIFLTGFGAVTLLALGVDVLLGAASAADHGGSAADGRLARVEQGLWVVTALLAVGAVLTATGLFTELWRSVLYAELAPDRAAILQRALPGIGRGFALATGMAALVTGLVALARRARLAPALIVAALAALVTVDGLRVDGPYLHTRDFIDWSAPDANVRRLTDEAGRRTEPFRVLDMNGSGQEVRLGMFGLELAAGHHPNDLARYRTLIGMQGSGLPEQLLFAPAVRRLLNVEYLVWPNLRFGPLEAQVDDLPALAGAELVGTTQLADGRTYESIYRLGDALPRARLVHDVRVADDERIAAELASGRVDPAATAFIAPEWASLAEGLVQVDPDPEPGLPVSPDAVIRWLDRSVDHAELEVSTDMPGLLVVADNWYPSWRAEIDGEAVDLGRADLTLRAVRIPAGTHRVRFEATLGTPARIGLWASVVGVISLLGLAVAGVRRTTGSTEDL